MKFTQKKIFVNKERNSIILANLPSEIEYYQFIQEKSEEDLNQLILTADIMLGILKFYFVDKKAKIVSIELMEDDASFQERCDSYINDMNEDRAYFHDFFEELKWLYSEQSIDLKKVRFKFREKGYPVDITLYINGIVNVNVNENTVVNEELERLLDKIKEIGKGIL